jgi:hypothetical protein
MFESEYVPGWCINHALPGWRDRTLDALYRTSPHAQDSRRAVFERIAFMNLVPENLGATNDVKVTDAQLRAGAATLSDRLHHIRPRVIWLASKRIQRFALPIALAYGAIVVRSKHPSRASNIDLALAWSDCWASAAP